MRLLLLDRLMQFIPNLSNVPGVRAIPFMQVNDEIPKLSQFNNLELKQSLINSTIIVGHFDANI